MKKNIPKWEKEMREYLNVKYIMLNVEKQPKGNREQWIDGDIDFFKEILLKYFKK